MPKISDTMEAYDAIAPVYEDYSNAKLPYLDAVDELVINEISSDARVLDVGAGDGRRLSKIQKSMSLTECVAVEPSSEMAKICRAAANCKVLEVFAEELAEQDIGTFDVITALWNVFGHINSKEKRVLALRAIASKLKPDGLFIMDVNNRHNAVAYGSMKVFGRAILDGIAFDEKRGDAHYEWKIGDRTFPGFGHLFTPQEIEDLFIQADLMVVERLSINYENGGVSKSPYKGQLFYKLKHKKK